ncbi:hypothetical protein M0Q50_04885 [bacterium]|jgi:hypothetical protein|nr:hypothetical protein [bacterium]
MAILKYDDYIRLSNQVKEAKNQAIIFIKDFFVKYEIGNIIFTLEDGDIIERQDDDDNTIRYLSTGISMKKFHEKSHNYDDIKIYTSTEDGVEKIFKLKDLEISEVGAILDEIKIIKTYEVIIFMIQNKKSDIVNKLLLKFDTDINDFMLSYMKKYIKDYINSYEFQDYYIDKYEIEDLDKMKLLAKYADIDSKIADKYSFFNMNNIGLF